MGMQMESPGCSAKGQGLCQCQLPGTCAGGWKGALSSEAAAVLLLPTEDSPVTCRLYQSSVAPATLEARQR